MGSTRTWASIAAAILAGASSSISAGATTRAAADLGHIPMAPLSRPHDFHGRVADATSPYFPPFTHFVIIYRENHTFDDLLGDCATTVNAGCNGKVMSPNHISSVPDLHKLAKAYALDDAYRTGTRPPSGPNHWWLFSAQAAGSSQQQSWPSTGTVFDRFLHGDTVPAQGTNVCHQTTRSGSGTSPYTMVLDGDIYSTVTPGSGYWRNPTDGRAEVLPIDRPGTNIPEELNYSQYACSHTRVSDSRVASSFLGFVKSYGLPAFSYVGLFNDHPGSAQNIPENDAETYDIVESLMSNPKYENNTLIIVTEDDTQNGANGPDHVSNTYRVPLVVIGSSTYVKHGYISHVAYTTSNVIAAMERVMENVKLGIINSAGKLGLTTFPMTTSDQTALGDPLSDFWVKGPLALSASASSSVTFGNAPLATRLSANVTGGTAPYRYIWDFGDGSGVSTTKDPVHTYTKPGTYTSTVTVTDSSHPSRRVTASVKIVVSPVGGTVPSAPMSVAATAGDGTVTLTWRPPASDGGEAVNAYEVLRGTSSGSETLVTSGGCANLAAVLTCVDTGVTNGTTYLYAVEAVNPIGTGPQSNEVSATPSSSSGGVTSS